MAEVAMQMTNRFQAVKMSFFKGSIHQNVLIRSASFYIVDFILNALC